MSWLTLREIAHMVRGRLIGDDVRVQSISTDTRTLVLGELFVALRGSQYDGHDIVERDSDLAAAGAMVSRELNTSLPQIMVDDTQLALSRLAEAWRERLDIRVIGLTGSNGKTTVKEMIASILAHKGKVLKTQGNLNNHIGVPLTILSIRPDHDFAVVEMGANHPGEIGGLTDIVEPDVALITNAAAAHLEGFCNLDGVAQAKAEIFNGLNPNGTAIINADDTYASYWRTRVSDHRSLTFGLISAADVYAERAIDNTLSVQTPSGSMNIRLPLKGRHNAINALAAIAATIAVGAGLDQVKLGLESIQPVGGRLVFKTGIRHTRILDDSYNANPASLHAALEVLSISPGEHWVVLGDMGELGDYAESLHQQAGKLARAHGIERLYTVGSFSEAAAFAFGEGAKHYKDLEELLYGLKQDLQHGVNVLIKGSRAMRMDKVVDALVVDELETEKNKGTGNAA